MPGEQVILETSRWLRYAKEDYEAAISLQSGIPRHSCLLAQQSAEKAIKSVYAFLDMPIPRSHDLDMLKNLLPDTWDVKTRFEDLSELSFWAVESRYPGDLPEAMAEDRENAIALARDVLASVEQCLLDNGFPALTETEE